MRSSHIKNEELVWVFIKYFVHTSETGGVLERVSAGVGEAADCCDSGCGVDNGSVLWRIRTNNRLDLQLFNK